MCSWHVHVPIGPSALLRGAVCTNKLTGTADTPGAAKCSWQAPDDSMTQIPCLTM